MNNAGVCVSLSTGCTLGTYNQNYVCVACIIGTGFVDLSNSTCISACTTGGYATDSIKKFCYASCSGRSFNLFNPTGPSMTCDSCISGYILPDGLLCIAACADFIYSPDGLRSCGDTLTCPLINPFKTLTNATMTLSCTSLCT